MNPAHLMAVQFVGKGSGYDLSIQNWVHDVARNCFVENCFGIGFTL